MYEGLTQEEARATLERDGYNELAPPERRDLWKIALEVMKEPMFLLLVASGFIYFFLGDMGEALALLFFVFVVMGITVYQENRTERALCALRDLTSPRANVVREGKDCRIAGREVVVGDILLLAKGDRIPADAVLLECNDFFADESLLTGESAPVRKFPSFPIHAGTMVTQGKGVARVNATGAASGIGRIGLAIQSVEPLKTPLQQEVARFVKNLTFVSALLFVILVVSYGILHADWLNGLLAGITMAMAILPEEFPVVLTVFLALGAWRIAKSQVLTRRLPAVETLGAASVLCVDKTGTLTENRMSVASLCSDGRFLDFSEAGALPEEFHSLVEYGILASEVDPFDPMEKAFHDLGERFLLETEHLHQDWEIVHEYSLSPELLAMSHVWKSSKRGIHAVAAKGSPEAIFSLCHLEGEELREWNDRVGKMAQQGLRVLGIASAIHAGEEWPAIQHDFEFRLEGLAGLFDPVRAGVPDAVRQCREAGIRVVMVTGDSPLTAGAIAKRIGMGSETLTGPELDAMEEAEFEKRVGRIDIFARVVPLQKLKIVDALIRQGETVAMTGDGVNDAPALKAAHIGVAMGRRGTDVAREAASLVLLDDDFSSIVRAVKLGRRIHANLGKAFSFSFSVHVPIAGLSLIPVFMNWPLIFQPVHIAFLQLIIDPVCYLVFEAEEADASVMKAPPGKRDAPLLGASAMIGSFLQGGIVLLSVILLYAGNLPEGAEHARAMAFSALVFANLATILAGRSDSMLAGLRKPNPLLWWVMGGAFSGLLGVIHFPFFQRLFGFSSLDPADLLLSFAIGTLSAISYALLRNAR
ncbi:MAG: cation-translocating P-type ATPase [Burkholderiales bacterium]|nr:cation-translocating P-type ATPase [Burkholderiales bacterium]